MVDLGRTHYTFTPSEDGDGSHLSLWRDYLTGFTGEETERSFASSWSDGIERNFIRLPGYTDTAGNELKDDSHEPEGRTLVPYDDLAWTWYPTIQRGPGDKPE